VCNKTAEEVGPISWRGFCGEHGVAKIMDNARSISEKRGEPYLHQQRRQFMAARKALLALEQAEG